MNFDGNYRLARAIAERLTLALPDAVRAQRAGDAPSQTRCAELLAFTRWHEFNIHYPLASMFSRPPFVNQLDHAVRQEALHQRIRELHGAVTAPGAMEEAVQCCRHAIDRWPDSWELHDHLATLLEEQGNVPEAIDHWREAVRLLPTNLDTVRHLATLLATSPVAEVRRGPEAVKLAEQAILLAGSPEAKLLETLAAAHAQAGQFAEAVAVADRALKMAIRERNTDLADTIRVHLRHYRAGTALPIQERPVSRS
jgi:tetratricopeptide (TPR) repeat protein